MVAPNIEQPLTLTEVLGFIADPEWGERIHAVAHSGAVDTIRLDRDDTLRRRLRVTTELGTVCQIALPRDQSLADGAILFLSDKRAIVVRMIEERWIRFTASDLSVALQLGYFVGNLHWRVKFAEREIWIAQEGPEATYLDRLAPFLADGRAIRVDDE